MIGTLEKLNYHMPTRILSRENCVVANRAILAELGKKALVVTGRSSARTSGAQGDIEQALRENGQSFALYDSVMPNPTIDCVFEAAAMARREQCDFIIAIGGGSPLDAGKAAAALAVTDINKDALFTASIEKALPIVAIPTTAGTGSEVTQYSVLTNNVERTKTTFTSSLIFPRYALLDARYMMGLERTATINTVIDALSHCVEGMLSLRASVLTDPMAKAGIQDIMECIDDIREERVNLAIREKLLWASTLGGMVIANTGTTIVHAAGYSLTYFKHIDHGRANGLLLGAYLRFVEEKEATKEKNAAGGRIGAILEAMNLNTLDEFDARIDGLLGIREKLTAEEIESYADTASRSKNVANSFGKPTPVDILEMWHRSCG